MTLFNKKYRHWHGKLDDHNVLWLAIDRHGSSVNSLDKNVIAEFDQVLDEIAANDKVRAVIIYSAKKSGFIAGADITQFTDIKTSDEAFQLLRQGQLTFNKLARLSIPTVAMIDGFCLGGGLELVLACRYRIAENSSHTKLGLPEVLLGIHPGWGGSVRLPELIGALKALQLIITGKIISAKEAYKYGFIDQAVPRRVLENAALSYALNAPPVHKASWFESLTNLGLVRPLIAKLFYEKLAHKIDKDQYPAPSAVIKNWQKFGIDGDLAMVHEAKSIGELIVHPTGRNLVRVFFLKERLKGLAKGLTFQPKHIHVVGAGTMGSAIAAWGVINGFSVTLQDQTPKLLAQGLKKAHSIVKAKLKSPREIMLAMDRLSLDIAGLGLPKADVIIEAIVEQLAAKHALYAQIEPLMKPGALLASNTSSLPLSELRKGLKDPGKIIGIHFFNPVERMELVEVVCDTKTSETLRNDAIAFVKRIKRLPLPVQSRPGFLVNRILMPYLIESVLLLEEGIPKEVIDKSAKNFGMPMGPIELIDRVGLDVGLSVAENLSEQLGGDAVPSRFRQMVSEGKLGTKSGEGFYRYQGQRLRHTTKSKPTKNLLHDEDIIDRLVLRILNEAVACLREHIVADADLLDAGMIFGTGFAPFRGGPIHYAKDRGIPEIIQRLEKFEKQYGARFAPDAGWQALDVKEKHHEQKHSSQSSRQRPHTESKNYTQ